jgi:hypothetical protein
VLGNAYAGLLILPVTVEFVFRRSPPKIPSEGAPPVSIFNPESFVAIFLEGKRQ